MEIIGDSKLKFASLFSVSIETREEPRRIVTITHLQIRNI